MYDVKITTTNEYFQEVDSMLAELEYDVKPGIDSIMLETEDKTYYYKIGQSGLNYYWYIVTD